MKLEICETCKFFNFKLGEWQGLNDLCLVQNKNELIFNVIENGKCDYYCNKSEWEEISEIIQNAIKRAGLSTEEVIELLNRQTQLKEINRNKCNK